MELILEKIDEAIKNLQTAKRILNSENKRLTIKYLDESKDKTQAALFLILAKLEEEDENGKQF